MEGWMVGGMNGWMDGSWRGAAVKYTTNYKDVEQGQCTEDYNTHKAEQIKI